MMCPFWVFESNFSFLPSFLLSVGVVSVSFEEDEEGNLCLIAYPLHSELGDLENVDFSSDLEPKNKTKRSNKMLMDNEGYSKDRARHSRKDKDKRWGYACLCLLFSYMSEG